MTKPYVPRHLSLVERFWFRAVVREGCWGWRKKNPSKSAYEVVRRGKQVVSATRLSWEIHFGSIPAGLFVCHHCDNPSCANPEHLFLGTHTDNMRDMKAKGRNAQSNRTHCRHGHEYSPENTRVWDGGRYCRECGRASGRAQRERQKLAKLYGENR